MVFKKGHQDNLGEKNGMWKGDKALYRAIHAWVRNNKPKVEFCEECFIKKPEDIACVGEYMRDITQYKWMCTKCHMVRDWKIRLSNNEDYQKKLKMLIDMYSKNIPIRKMSRITGIERTTISNMLKREGLK